MATATSHFVTNVNVLQGYRRTNWMLHVPGDLLLSQLNIPGTHDTGALYWGDPVVTQTQTLDSQLANGIRFLDIRGHHMSDRLYVYHGSFDQKLTFSAVQEKCHAFLQANPSECIVMSLKQEEDDEDVTRTYEDTFDWYVSKLPAGSYYLEDRVPTLDEVRGKIVLVRRFDAKRPPKGIDCTNWPDNAMFTITDAAGVKLQVQDCYKVPTLLDIEQKWHRVAQWLQQAADTGRTRANDWYLNFTSGFGMAVAFPNAVAEGSGPYTGVNTSLDGYLASQSRARFGTVIMDFPEFPEDHLMPRIISLNPLNNAWTPPFDLTRFNQAASKGKPALAALNGKLHMAFVDSNPAKTDLWICSGSGLEKAGWNPCVNVAQLNHAASKAEPALAAFNGRLYMAFLDDNPSKSDLWVCQSPDGRNWSACTNITQQNRAASKAAPALAAFNGKLYMAFLDSDRQGDLSHPLGKTDLWICSSSDGTNWGPATNITSQNRAATKAAPALAAFKDRLYMAFVDSDPAKTDIWICASADGTNWQPCLNVTQLNKAATVSIPALAAMNGYLCLAFKDTSNAGIWICSSYDGNVWSGCNNVTGQNLASTRMAPALVFQGSTLTMAFLDDNPTLPDLWLCSIDPLV